MGIATLGVVLALPAGALGATVATDRACYNADGSDAVSVTGSGFTPGALVNVLVDNKVSSTPLVAGADGSVTTKLPVPNPPQGGPTAHDRSYGLRLQESGEGGVTGAVASTTFSAADLFGDYSPNARSLLSKVRFFASGFALGQPRGAAMPAIYVHYVDPRGKARLTVPLGTGQGPCGTIRRTKRMRIFPFVPRSGTWTLQFDTSRRYVKGSDTSPFRNYRLTLTI